MVFALPMAAAWWFYLHPDQVPQARTSHGELVQPPRPLRDTQLLTLDGRAMRLSELRGKWTLVFFSASRCDEPCQRKLYEMRQIQLALGQDQERAQRLTILRDAAALDQFRQGLREYPGMWVLHGAPGAVIDLAAQFPSLPSAGSAPGGLYLVDPLGNLVLSYSPGANPRGILKDLQRLLKYSWVG
jgi:cytochrome oxidase Cu insertion factor (SCO1/SenC/PrrC family)